MMTINSLTAALEAKDAERKAAEAVLNEKKTKIDRAISEVMSDMSGLIGTINYLHGLGAGRADCVNAIIGTIIEKVAGEGIKIGGDVRLFIISGITGRATGTVKMNGYEYAPDMPFAALVILDISNVDFVARSIIEAMSD